jgi:outer membrane receptor protein involved in Fe transport
MIRTTLRVRRGLLGATALVALTALHPTSLRAEPAEPTEATADPTSAAAEDATAAEAGGEAGAQTAPSDRAPKRGIEEITVTARRREEVLQNTPLAITAFSETELEARGVQSITEITQSTPNLQFDSAAGSDSNARIFIRGVGQADPIFTADPGVGLYVDGVSYTRSAGSIFDLLDIERVEVLRGPQGALYGKSTIGGAINVITKKPDGEWEGSIRGAIGEDRRRDAQFRLGFPIMGEQLFGRIALVTKNNDGFSRDASTDEKLQNEQKILGRASFRWLADDDLEFTATFDRGFQREESLAFKLREVDNDNGLITVGNSLGDNFGAGLLIRNPFLVSTDTPSRDDLDTYGMSLNTNYSVGDTFFGKDVSVELITAWRKVEQRVNVDIDGTASGGINQFIDDEQRQFSQEVRMRGSALDDKLDYGIGAFYFREDGQGTLRTELFRSGSQAVRDTRAAVRCTSADGFDFDAQADIFQDPNSTQQQQDDAVTTVVDRVFLGGAIGPIRDPATGANVIRSNPACSAVVNPDNVVRLLNPQGGAATGGPVDVNALLRGLATALLAVPDENTVSTNNAILNTNYAAYAYASYDVTDKVSVELAGRYNYEIKDLFRNQLLVPSGQAVIDNASNDTIFRDFSPTASISWQMTDDQLSFFRIARGFKSGGFNGRAQRLRRGGVSSTEAKGLLAPYDPETITSFELGYKSTWLDRRFIFNTTAFYNLYDDIQQQRLGQDESGQLTSIIDNAAQAIIQGLEIEMTALLPTNTTLTFGSALTSARFTSFPNAISNPAFDPDDPTSTEPRAFSGTELHLANTPLFSANASVSQDIELPWGMLTARTDYFMRSRAFNNVRNTRATRTNKFGVLNARLAFEPNDGNWTVAVICRNVLDREYLINGVDLLEAFGFASGQFGPPRDFYIEASYRF